MFVEEDCASLPILLADLTNQGQVERPQSATERHPFEELPRLVASPSPDCEESPVMSTHLESEKEMEQR